MLYLLLSFDFILLCLTVIFVVFFLNQFNAGLFIHKRFPEVEAKKSYAEGREYDE